MIVLADFVMFLVYCMALNIKGQKVVYSYTPELL